jgi:gliding motility-associated-like protein
MKNHDSKNLLVSIIKRNTIVAVTLVFVFVASGMTVASRHNANEDLYVPSILLIKTGVARDATGADNGCAIIEYTFTVTNTSTNGEILTGVQLTDPSLGGLVAGPAEGDVNVIGEMDPGETWIYRANYIIQPADIVNGSVTNQANVVADVLGQPGVTVSDLSDDDGINDSDETVTDLSFCQGNIGLIKTGVAIAGIDAGPGCNFILYTFLVSNEGGQVLENVELIDPLIGVDPIAGPIAGDTNGNTLLDTDEVWQYSVLYDITPEDINNGQVVNQAEVTADVQGFGTSVSDLSDNDSYAEDEATVIELTQCQGDIALIKTGLAIEDIDAGAGCNYVLYSFTVTNVGEQPLQNVAIADPLLNGDTPTYLSGDDNDNDLLDIDESWSYFAIYDITASDVLNGQVVNQAEVTAHVEGEPLNTVSDLSDDDSILEDDPTIISLDDCQANFGIALIKTGFAVNDVDAGAGCNFVLYTFSVTNISGETLENITITDPLLEGIPIDLVAGDDNDNSQMESDEVWLFTSAYPIQPSDIANGSVINQAEVSATVLNEPDIILTDLSDDDSLLEDDPTVVDLTQCQVPNIGLIKEGVVIDVNEDGCLESILYTFTVTNTGNADLDEITLEDPLFGGNIPGPVDGSDVNNDGILSVNESWTYEALYAITQQDIDNAAVVNQATVTGYTAADAMVQDLSDDDNLFEDEPTRTPVPDDACTDGAAIGLIKQGVLVDNNGDGCIESILYTFTVTNTGGIDLDEVNLEDPLFGGPIPGPLAGTDTNDDGILSVGETWTYEALYGITQEDIDNAAVINQATVTAEPVGFDSQVFDLSDDDSLLEDEPTRTPVPDDACTDGTASIGLIKEGVLIDATGDGCIDSVLYTFTVTNNGAFDLDEVNLEDPLFGGPIPGPVDGTDVNNDDILSVGETWTYEAVYALEQEDIDNGAVINQATVTAERINFELQVFDLSDDDNLLENEPTRTPVPDDACTDGVASIAMIKEGVLIDVNGDGCLESILYTFTITNNGAFDLDEVSLEDPLFGGSIPGPVDGTDENNDSILSIGETWTYEALYAITQNDIDNGAVINQATVTAERINFELEVSDFSDDDNLLEDDPTRTPVPEDACNEGSASIGLIKEGALADINEDDCVESILYTFTVTNNGGADLDTVVLADPLIEGEISGPVNDTDINNDGILSVGETWTYQALYAITQQDVDNGAVLNQATVTAEPLGFDFEVFDFSDDDSFLENEPTEIAVPNDACTDGSTGGDGGDGDGLNGIGLIKQATLLDSNNDNCVDTIGFTFTVLNGSIGNIENVVLTDGLLGGVISGPIENSDENEDGILSSGETWTYEFSYSLTQTDIDAGVFINQATVVGDIVGFDFQLKDLSDNNSYTEDDPTEITIPNNACSDGGAIGFQIFNGITPNGDGFNDFFRILGIENYPNNNLKIFNRWGVKVYETDGYGQGNNLFYGISEGRATLQQDRELPSGTYFYILTFTGTENPGEESYTGYLYINHN